MKKSSKSNKKIFFLDKYRPYLVPITAFAGLALIVLILVIQATSVSITLSKLIDHSSKSKESIDAIVQTLLIETKYTNELRSQIGLSEITYPIEKLLDNKNKDNGDSAKNLSYFRAIDKLYNSNIEEKNVSAFHAILKNNDFQSFIKENKFATKESDSLSIGLIKSELAYFTIRYIAESNSISIESYLGDKLEKVLFSNSTFDILKNVIKKIDAHNALLDTTLVSFSKIKDNQNLLSELKDKDLSIANVENTQELYTLAAARKTTYYLRFGLDKKTLSYFIEDQKMNSYEDFQIALLEAAKKIDTRDETEKMVGKLGDEIKAIISDKSFKTLLDIKKLSVASEPRPDYYFMFYDIKDSGGKKVGAFAIDRFHPAVYLMDKDDVQLSSLAALIDQTAEVDVKKN
jgi:hypothetical protein